MNGKQVSVAIVGGGPAGIGAAVGLARRGVSPVLLLERRAELGGVPASYRATPDGVPTFVDWTRGRVLHGERFVEKLRRELERTETEVWLETQVLEIDADKRRLTLVNPAVGKSHVTADAIILACGAREKTPIERGWLEGKRPSRVLFTRNLVDLMDRIGYPPLRRPAILGSDLIAHSAAAKLRAAGSGEPEMFDRRPSPAASFFERLYFRRWTQPRWSGGIEKAQLKGDDAATCVRLDGNVPVDCDGLVISGDLVPSSELALLGGLEVELPSRRPVVGRKLELSRPGWFIAGNLIGGFHGAQWCYFHGKRAAKFVAGYLASR